MAGRKKTTAAPVTEDVLPSDVIEATTQSQNDADEHGALISAQFGDGQPYERTRVVTEAKFFMAQSAEAMLEAGKRLILIKEHEPHGDFIEIVEHQLGIHERAARRMMSAAVKYLSPKLESKRTTLSVLGKSKLIELIAEDDDELAALAEGGTLAGMKLDEIDRMSCRELKKALRDAKEDYEAQGELLAKVSSERDKAKQDLTKERRRIKTLAVEEAEKELRQQAAEVAFQAELSLSRDLREVCSTVLQFAEEKGIDYRGYLAGMVRQMELKLMDLREEFGLPDDGDPEDFSWMGKEMLDSIESEQG